MAWCKPLSKYWRYIKWFFVKQSFREEYKRRATRGGHIFKQLKAFPNFSLVPVPIWGFFSASCRFEIQRLKFRNNLIRSAFTVVCLVGTARTIPRYKTILLSHICFVRSQSTPRMRLNDEGKEKNKKTTENEVGKRKNKRNIRQPKRSGVESNATKTRSSRRREKRDGFYLEWSRQRYQVARLRELCSTERVLTSAFLQIHDLPECFCRFITVVR